MVLADCAFALPAAPQPALPGPAFQAVVAGRVESGDDPIFLPRHEAQGLCSHASKPLAPLAGSMLASEPERLWAHE